MTNSLRLITLIMAMSLMTAAHGQSTDWYATGSIVYTNDDPDRRIDDAVGGAQFSVGWDFSDYLTLEGALGYSKIDGFYRQNGVWVRDYETHLDLSANLLAYFDRERPFAPYVALGFGYLGVNYNLSGEENRPSASLSLGFDWKPVDNSQWSLRSEYRARLAYEQDNNLVDNLFTLGVKYDFDGPNLFQRSGGSAPAAAMAPGLWGDWYVAGSIVYNDDDPDRRFDDGISGLQFNVGRHITDYLTLEGQLGYSDIDGFFFRNGAWVRDSVSQLDVSANLLAFYDRNRAFAPYIIAGIGYLGQSVNGGGDENRPSATLGAGFKWRIGQSRFSIRNEYRARLAYEQDLNYTDFVATLGVEYAFGDRRRDPGRPDLPQDTDGDGVLDMWDECPDTPRGVAVNARGCEIKEIDRDSDNDRVPDSRDKCPNTPIGIAVDPDGCSLDSDLDGVPTAIDRCPGSIAGGLVDQFGCDDDTDGDRVRNMADRCPNSRWRAEVDPYGCEIRDVISLPGVNFQSGSDLLLAGAENLIRDIASTLNENDYLQIEVAGHTDSQGSDENNRGLSDRRAKTVYDFLIMYGVDEERLSFRGYGESQPIADNQTADGRATNRRVELRVVRR